MTQIQFDLRDFGWRVENCDRNSVISADRSTFGRNKLFRQNNREALKSQKDLLPNIRPNNGRNSSAEALYGRSLDLEMISGDFEILADLATDCLLPAADPVLRDDGHAGQDEGEAAQGQGEEHLERDEISHICTRMYLKNS